MTDTKAPNEALARAIAEAGCTYQALATTVRAVASEAGEHLAIPPSAVAHWVAGGTPTGRTPQYLAEALTRRTRRKVTVAEIGLGSEAIGEVMSADPLATAADLGRAVMKSRRDFLASAFATAAVALPLTYDHQAVAATLRAGRTGGRVGVGEVATVRHITGVFTAADERLGGGHGLSAVTTYLTDTVVPMLQAVYPSDGVRRDAYGVAAELSYLAAWKYHDLGREGAAQRYYLLGYQLACESEPTGHGAWMMRALAHQALNLKQPEFCVELAEESLRRARGKVDPQTEALLLITSARAYGAVGSGQKAAAALLSAEDAMLDTATPPASFTAATGPVAATVASHTAKTLAELKDHQAAERHHRAALAGRDPEAFRRIHALTLGNLARSVAAQRRHDEAVGIWGQSLDFMDGVVSDRHKKELRKVRTTMTSWARRGIPGAADLGQRAAELVRA
ncbi:tetratricopeptide repeat protein [Kitasatospora sp. NPDC058406]|uniref:tetratricopeptide repeat protein n=1 Tax=Kitasatospora sp. NPDC058406 TaxID=3346483 RepID=UPI0036678E7F